MGGGVLCWVLHGFNSFKSRKSNQNQTTWRDLLQEELLAVVVANGCSSGDHTCAVLLLCAGSFR